MLSLLVEKAQQDLSDEKIKETEEELKKGIFTMDSYLISVKTNEKNGRNGRSNVQCFLE